MKEDDIFETDTGEDSKDPDPEDSDEFEAVEVAERVGYAIAAIPMAVVSLLMSLFGGIAWAISSKLPKRKAIYQKMVRLGYQGLYKNTSAHVVTNTIYGDGEMVPRASTLDSETSTLETDNGEEWTVSSGLQPTRIGDAPVVTGVADHHELVDHIAARVTEARDLSNKRFQTVQNKADGVHPVQTGNVQGETVADGGETLLERSTTFDDIWLDASNPDPTNDGWIVSMEKAYDLHWDRAATEEMENQETRGILAAKDPKKDKKQMIIVIAAVIGSFCLGLFGPALATQLAGSAGDAAGGGGGVSLMIDLVGWWYAG